MLLSFVLLSQGRKRNEDCCNRHGGCPQPTSEFSAAVCAAEPCMALPTSLHIEALVSFLSSHGSAWKWKRVTTSEKQATTSVGWGPASYGPQKQFWTTFYLDWAPGAPSNHHINKALSTPFPPSTSQPLPSHSCLQNTLNTPPAPRTQVLLLEELKVRQLWSEWSGLRSWENWEARFWRGAGITHPHSENTGPPRGTRQSERASGRRESTSGKLDLRQYGQEGESTKREGLQD